MHINNNAQKLAVENILNQIGELYTKIGDEVILYPLRIVSGIVDFTENGEFPLRYNIDSFTSNLGVITSNEPIICYWEGAYKSYVPTDILGANYQLKEMSAEKGRKIKTWIMQYSTDLVNNEQQINDNSYTTITLNRNIRSFCTDWVPTDNEMRNYLYLYLDKKAKSPQFLKMISKEPRYLPGGKLAGCELAFTNLNQEYSQSGKDILNFVKMVHPGGNYPFPKEILTENGVEVVLDYNRVNNRGINDIQLQFWNSYWLNSITVYGAPKSNWKIEAPRKLLLVNARPPISSSLDVDGSALNNYYALFEVQTLYKQFWATWKDKVQSYYDYTAQKKFMGGFQIKSQNWNEVVATNPIVNDTSTYNMWNNWTFTPAKDVTFSCPETPFTDSTITFKNGTSYKPEDFLNHNSFIFACMEALPMEFTETTRYTLGDFGVLGRILQGFVQIFTGGFNPGWTTNNTWVPNKSVNFLMPTSTFDFGRAMTSSGEGKNDPIPFDCVNPEFSAGGNKTCVCGYRFQLTRYFQSPSQVIEGAEVEGEGKNGIWDTKYLGQTQWEDGSWIFADHQPLKWKSDCKAISPIEKDEEYEAFLVSYKGIGLTTCRMTFYNYINHDPANVESVWESRQLTNAKFKNDITLWTNTYKLNFSEEMNNEGVIDYPRNVVPPSPQALPIRINDFEGVFAKDTGQQGRMKVDDLSHGIRDGLSTSHIFDITPDEGRAHLVHYKQVFDNQKNKVSFDLTKKIGAGKLSDYKSFSFNFRALHANNYDFPKNVTINISDLKDNQWTPVKIADCAEIIAGSHKDAFPNWQFAEDVGHRTYLYSKELIPVSKNLPIPSSTPAYVWIKLNKTSQIMEMYVGGITLDDYPRSEEKQLAHCEVVSTFDVQYSNEQIITLSESDVGGDYIYLDDFTFELTYTNHSLTHKIDQSGIAIPKEILTEGYSYVVGEWQYLFREYSTHVENKITLTNIGNNQIKVKTEVKGFDYTHWKLNLFFRVMGNEYARSIIRNYYWTDGQVAGGVYYGNDTFFTGYKIQDFYINPNT